MMTSLFKMATIPIMTFRNKAAEWFKLLLPFAIALATILFLGNLFGAVGIVTWFETHRSVISSFFQFQDKVQAVVWTSICGLFVTFIPTFISAIIGTRIHLQCIEKGLTRGSFFRRMVLLAPLLPTYPGGRSKLCSAHAF